MKSLLGLIFLFAAGEISYAKNSVENLVVTEAADGSSALVVIETEKKILYSVREISFPPQVQIHILDEVSCGTEILRKIDKKLVQGVKFICKDKSGADRPQPMLNSINILLNSPAAASLSQNGWILSVALKRKGGADSPSSAAPSGSQPQPDAYSIPAANAADLNDANYGFYDEADRPQMSLSARPSADEILRVGLANHRPLQIAGQELSLARRKLFEARRNFFPVLSGRGTRVSGKTQSDPSDERTIANFIRREIGVEVGQPIFQSGRIFYSEKQARAQRDIAELQLIKTHQEAAFEIIKTLYGYILAREAVLIRRAVNGECKHIVDTTQKKKEIGVASESEYLGVVSAAKQFNYKVMSQEKDFHIAESRLLAAMSLEDGLGDPDIRLESAFSTSPQPQMALDSVLNNAVSNRSELKIALLSRKYQEYARKAARGDYLLKVDASAFVGQSGASFRSETLEMKDSYNLGVKGVLYFGGSSFSPSATTDKSAPDLGSTSRTETESQSVTIGVLDSLGAASKVLEAKIQEQKSGEELRKVKKDVALEAKEAFYNYEKAKLQVDSAKSELEYRKKEASIAQEKDRLHQIDATQYLQALTAHAEAEIGLREAMSFYLISTAALEKATGTSLKPLR